MFRIQYLVRSILPIYVILFCAIALTAQQNSPTAEYRVTFYATWNPVDHPVDFPNFDHFSGLVGMTHNQQADLFVEGQLASPGIIQMAEIGSKTTLINEVTQYISNGTAKDVISGGALNTGTGMVSVDIEVDQTHPLASITAMIAPSPDWFIGVHDVDLFSQGQWASMVTMQVGVYDSGSDSGLTFASPNQVTQPQEVVHTITTPPLAMNGVVPSMGTMVFERINSITDCSNQHLTFHDSPILPNTYRTNQTIVSTGEVMQDERVVFQAGTFIHLEEDFATQTGGVLELVIAGCN